MDLPSVPREPITEDWLRSVGFKWSQFDRQPEKMWLLWIGDALVEQGEPRRWRFSCYEDLGVEVTANVPGQPDDWFCWLRSDTAGRYHRFIHLRHIRYQDELIGIIEGVTGRPWDPQNIIYGSMLPPEAAARLRQEHERLDLRLRRERPPWYSQEKDDSRARPLTQHVEAAIEGGHAR